MLRSVGNLMLHFAETIDGLHDGLCEAVRFISADTIEEKIIKLQEKKQLVFDASIDGSSTSLGKLTEQDLRFLFQH
ncbi:unnamed protein product [Durusdinium trenchii]|uniref:Uncharacterized protein n=1 Tax=Durusdinium trenchii TaxID=1381693 RepID=A0ABP0MDP9_9DINO